MIETGLGSIIGQLEKQREAIDNALLSLRGIQGTPAKKRGRPTGSKNGIRKHAPAAPKKRLSAEGRARIIEATKKRWALERAKKKAKG